MCCSFLTAFIAIKSTSAIACGTVLECSQQSVEAALKAETASKISVPSGAVMAFNLSECPQGWKELKEASGRVLVGAGNGNRDQKDKPLTDRKLGATGGEETHVLTVQEMPAHHHTVIFTDHHNTPANTDTSPNEWGNTNSSTNTQDTGGGAEHNNMPPYLVLLYCQRM